jgi:hypothetical protein
MEETNKSTENLAGQPKKPYNKPVVFQVRLVAEEAVLALCKWGSASLRLQCAPDLSCLSTARS